MELEEGAKIIINRWLKLKPWDRLMIVAGEKNMAEAEVLKRQAEKRTHADSMWASSLTSIPISLILTTRCLRLRSTAL